MLDVAHEWVSNESNLLPPCLHATAKKPRSLGVRRGVVLKGREQEFPPTLQSILGRNTFKTLPDPTGSRTFVTSYIFVDWRKLSPRSAFSGPLSLLTWYVFGNATQLGACPPADSKTWTMIWANGHLGKKSRFLENPTCCKYQINFRFYPGELKKLQVIFYVFVAQE